jgi:hypothetical protein
VSGLTIDTAAILVGLRLLPGEQPAAGLKRKSNYPLVFGGTAWREGDRVGDNETRWGPLTDVNAVKSGTRSANGSLVTIEGGVAGRLLATTENGAERFAVNQTS